MKALDAFLGWCESDTSCALRDAGAPRDVFNQLLNQFNATPMPAEYTVNGATPRGHAHGKPVRDRGDLDAVRRVARVADPRSRIAPATRGDAGALLQLSDNYLVVASTASTRRPERRTR